MNYNAVVMGAGPGGYVAALRLAGSGLKVAVVERENVGGTCLNWGCIPTKTLLHNSETIANMVHGREHGIVVDKWDVDMPAMINRKNNVVQKLRSGVAGLLKGRKVDTYTGQGRITGPNQVEVTDADGKTTALDTENIIIATGGDSAVPGFFPQDRSKVMTSREILDLEQKPDSLVVVGGGVIGCEFATFFSEIGVKVTVVEMLDRLLPMADKDVSKTITKVLTKGGVDVNVGTSVTEMKIDGDKVVTKLADGQTLATDYALICTGRRPLSQDIGLETVGVKTDDKGFIEIDEYCCTNVPNVYAIGDVTGKMQLAHVASRQAAVAANNILGNEDTEDYAIVPCAVYTHPEIAWVGLTLDQAKAQGIDAREGSFSMMALGMALAYHATEGFVKLVVDADDVILGAHLVCPHASDMIQEIAVLMKSECTLHELHATIHGHPTFAESLAEATDALLGQPLHSH